jgi:hypothetical protein
MLSLLRVPPLARLVIVLAAGAYVVYRIASIGTVQPLTLIALVLLAFAVVRDLYRMRRTSQENEND